MVLPVRVIKLGGSLLGYPKLKNKLAAWVFAQSPADNLVVVGGGKVADGIRHWQELRDVSDIDAHWAAIDAMSVNARLLHELLRWEIVDRQQEPTAGPRTRILDVASFMKNDATRADALDQDWTVTSDSIAARVADRFGAFELVLVKSVDRRVVGTVGVDRRFAETIPPGLPVRWLNLRSHRRCSEGSGGF